ncbi:uncharacterized protein LOC131165336 isoform X2 [Malania oleifera]|nr:uncharacterized protein LOC131165336 isoform X2 [Malania oleifera]XP_057979003.1 uncharacterized protein LOC131165336 isoform X2 [Malania oleifera]
MFGSGTGISRGSSLLTGDLPSLSQCLMLEPITMVDQKYTRSGELRRALGISFGSTAENNSFGAAHSKPTPPVATEEIKRIRTSVADTCSKAKVRVKRFDESLGKLSKLCDAMATKKQQRNDMAASERNGGSNLLKIGNQIHRNSPDIGNQRVEDRTKNVGLNKRLRTSMAEARIQAEGRSNGLSRPPSVMGKDNRDTLKDSNACSDPVEEKIRRLPAGGEGWDKKMKRKRSVGAGSTRPIDGDGELKRAMHHKISNEPGLQSIDPHSFRSGSYNNTSGINKMDGNSLPAGSNNRTAPKNDLEKVCLSRDPTTGLNKERHIVKANNKSNIREDNHVTSPGSVMKGKASRAPRTGPVMAANSSPNFPRATGALEGWEQPQNVNKVHSVGGTSNRKRPMPTRSSSPPMAQWVGQRPQKISRTRRANLVSPVSNHDELQMSSEGCPPTDFGARITSNVTNGSHLAKSVANGTQQFKVKLENVSSPARLSESEESGAGENRLKEKGMGNCEGEERAANAVQNVGPVLASQKNKTLSKEETGDGVRRQGRTGRGSSFSRASISPMREKLETPATMKPLRSTRPSTDKNGSKSGRPPLKKLSDRKAFSRHGHPPNNGSPDFTGESDDDREELLAAAKYASSARYAACSGPFWKKMEPYFASCMEDISFLKQQLKIAEELPKGQSKIFGHDSNTLCDPAREEISPSQTLISGESLSNQVGSAMSLDLVDQLQDIDLCGRLDSESCDFNAPLYQRVLSALIVEDEIEGFEEINMGRNGLSQCSRDDSACGMCLHNAVEPGKRDKMEFEYDSILGQADQKQCTVDRFSCNGVTGLNKSQSICSPSCYDELLQGEQGFVHSDIRVFNEYSQNGLNDVHANISGGSPFDCQYEQMPLDEKILLELQSIGLYPETVPDLAEGDDEVINQEIVKLKKKLLQEMGKKKAHLIKLFRTIQEEKEVEERDLEQVAMDRLLELACKKLLATRGSNASKSGISKVSRHVALGFVKRTLARCKKFEESGKSCFSELPLRDLLFSAPPRANDAESLNCVGLAVATDLRPVTLKSQRELRTSGPLFSGADRHDLHNDQTDRGSLDAFESLASPSDQVFAKNGPISNRGKKKEVLLDDVGASAALRTTSALGSTLSGGAKGKRSERDRDKDMLTRNSVAKAGRPTVGNFRGERKTKSKPKQQKTAQLSTSGNGFASRFTETAHSVHPSASGSSESFTNSSNKKHEIGLTSPGNIPQDSSKEIKEPVDFANLQLHELDSIEELGVSNDLSGHQDLSSWLNFDEDGLQDHDSMGLEIPMDDLSELNMLM